MPLRKEKPVQIENDHMELMNKVFNLSLQVNAKGNYFTWVDFHGHVSQLVVRATTVENTDDWLFNVGTYFAEDMVSKEEITVNLTLMVSKLEELLKDDFIVVRGKKFKLVAVEE